MFRNAGVSSITFVETAFPIKVNEYDPRHAVDIEHCLIDEWQVGQDLVHDTHVGIEHVDPAERNREARNHE